MAKRDEILNKFAQLGSKGIDTKTLSEILNMSRANLSHELNNLCREGLLKKTTTRPVMYSLANAKGKSINVSQLDILSENNVSLREAVEQAKAAILYPPKGMNCLILGETGTGKSMFASLMYNYSIKMHKKPEDAPFVIFNCADYSSNPQLLTSQLFGVKKGAYTGAESDKVGLIEKADGGILFLDEVHRLPPEGQESLFIFLDTGSFRRVGDSEIRKADVLIISATTENPDSALLNTFRRRIPLVINIPSLKERSFEERLFLIKSFFKHESTRLNKEIYVSLNTLRALISYDCPNNIGQLKSDVQMLCAKAYSEYLTRQHADVRISSHTLPPYIKEGLYKEKEHRALWNNLMSEEIEFFRFNENTTMRNEPIDLYPENENTMYDFMESKLKKLKSLDFSDFYIEDILQDDIARHFKLKKNPSSFELTRKNLLSIIDEQILNFVDKATAYICDKLPIMFDNNLYTAFALHINTLINRVTSGKTVLNNNLEKIKSVYPKEFQIALDIKCMLSEFLNVDIPVDEAAYITIFLISDQNLKGKKDDKVKIIVIAHGETTASSMADVANRLLMENYVLPVNASLDIEPQKVLERLKLLIHDNPTSAGYLVLVDMGSLLPLAETAKTELGVDLRVISLVSTLHVLEAARKALLGLSLNTIYNDVLLVNSYLQVNKNVNNIAVSTEKTLIITACLTGEGAAQGIKDYLSTNLTIDYDIFEIVCLSCNDKRGFKDMIYNYERSHRILFVVSSFPIDSLNVPQFTMYETLNKDTVKQMQDLINGQITMLNIPEVINDNFPNVAGTELTNDIQYVLNNLKERTGKIFTPDEIVGLTLHLSFLIGKLKNNENTIYYPNKEMFIKDNFKNYNIVKECLTPLKEKYNLNNLSDNDICYLADTICGKN